LLVGGDFGEQLAGAVAVALVQHRHRSHSPALPKNGLPAWASGASQ
jgi:hypothetical protein